MNKGLSMDISFDFENDLTSTVGVDGDLNYGTCSACGRRYRHYMLPLPFGGWRGGEHGPEYAEEGASYCYGVLCGDCVLSSPAELAGRFHARGMKILQRFRRNFPRTAIERKRREKAEEMIEFASELEKVGDIRNLPGGLMATKIAEAYLELDNPPKARKGKAA